MQIPFVKDLKIRNKILLVPIPAAIAFGLILIVNSYLGSTNNKLMSEIDRKFFPALEISRQMQETLNAIQSNMQYASSTKDTELLVKYDKYRDDFLSSLNKGRSERILINDEVDFLEKEFKTYYPLAKEATRKKIENGSDKQVVKDLDKMQKVYNGIQKKLTQMIAQKKADMTAAVSKANENQEDLFTAIIIVMVLSVFWQIIFTVFFTRSITRPLHKIVSAANEMAKGNVDVNIEVTSKDEIGDLAKSTLALIEASKELTRAADAIGQGNYDIDVGMRGDKDILSNAIARMKNNLLEMTRGNVDQNWLKTGLANLSEKLRGDQNVTELAQNIINFVSEYLGSKIGAIYLLESKDTLHLTGSYAYLKRKGFSNNFKVGEGLVGQSALERKTILISNVPDDYIKINSGLGESVPLNIIVVPLAYDEEIAGVIELGSFNEYNDLQTHFLEQASESIAIAFHSAIARRTVNELLEETQNQAAELQAQQEELRVTNEELEEQTNSLKQSEETLRKQQEELQKSNEELESHTEVLKERQQELENARSEIEQKAKQLEESSKYKSEFLANMSHELRTPLNSIQILSRLLAENKNGKLDEKQINYAKTIHASGADLLNLINEILDLSKIEAGRMVINLENMQIATLAKYLKNNFEHQTSEKKLYFKVETDKNLPANVITDRQRLEQILKNLISNALKFTSEGGITVKMCLTDKKTKINRSGLNVDESMTISVLDTGIGIKPENLNKIFEAFQQEDGTTSRKFGGTGLGLSISMQLARLLGGEIQVESEVGKGSIFSFYLPLEHPDAGKADIIVNPDELNDILAVESVEIYNEKNPIQAFSEIRDDRNDLDNESHRLLIVEDNYDFSQILFNFARERKYKCLIAGDGEAGLQMAYQYHPHAIILDVGLPRMDGWDVIDKLKSNPATRHIPVFFISGQEMKIKAMQKGAIGVLTKPVTREELDFAFSKIAVKISTSVKKLLLVEDDNVMRSSLTQLIENDNVKVYEAEKGNDALKLLENENFDCMVLDLGLSDISGFNLIEKIKKNKKIDEIPIIIYTGKDLTKKEETQLKKYSESIIIKGVKSTDRLLDEVSLFLHTEKDKTVENREEKSEKESVKNRFWNKKVLVADDDVRNIFALTSILEDEGVEVLVAENGREAVEMVQKNPDTNLVLMDVMMPEMDGYEAIKIIREQKKFSQLPIITLTAKAMKGDRQKCIEAGANDYLSKPLDVEKLLSLLQIWMPGNN